MTTIGCRAFSPIVYMQRCGALSRGLIMDDKGKKGLDNVELYLGC